MWSRCDSWLKSASQKEIWRSKWQFWSKRANLLISTTHSLFLLFQSWKLFWKNRYSTQNRCCTFGQGDRHNPTSHCRNACVESWKRNIFLKMATAVVELESNFPNGLFSTGHLSTKQTDILPADRLTDSYIAYPRPSVRGWLALPRPKAKQFRTSSCWLLEVLEYVMTTVYCSSRATLATSSPFCRRARRRVPLLPKKTVLLNRSVLAARNSEINVPTLPQFWSQHNFSQACFDFS